MGAEEAARRGMERRGRLADLLAVPAGELLPHRLDDLEAARDLLQRLGHVLAQLRQPRSAAAGAARRRFDDDALALDVVRPGLAHRPLAREGAHGWFSPPRPAPRVHPRSQRPPVLRAAIPAGRSAAGCAPGAGRTFAFQLVDQQLQMRDQRLGVGQLRLRVGRFGLQLPQPYRPARASRSASTRSRASRSACNASRSTAARHGRWQGPKEERGVECHDAIESDFPVNSIAKCCQTRVGRQVS